MVWLYGDAEICADRYDAASLKAYTSRELKVPAAQELALTFANNWRSTTHLYNCALTTSFVPEPGVAYRVDLEKQGMVCSVAVVRKDAPADTRRVHARRLELRKQGVEGTGYCVSHRDDPDLGAYFRKAETRAESNALIAGVENRLREKDAAGALADINKAAMLGHPVALLRLCAVLANESASPRVLAKGYAWCSVALGALPRFYAEGRSEAAYLRADMRSRLSDEDAALAKEEADEILREIRAR